jgi:hypothetical protein
LKPAFPGWYVILIGTGSDEESNGSVVSATDTFGTYTQAGEEYDTTLLWPLALLIPVLYVQPRVHSPI